MVCFVLCVMRYRFAFFGSLSVEAVEETRVDLTSNSQEQRIKNPFRDAVVMHRGTPGAVMH